MIRDNKQKLMEYLRAEVEAGYACGIQAAVFENGHESFYSAYGMADRERGIFMSRDTVCRLYSLTKPVTAVAVWILKERGLLDFSRAVKDYLPQFSDMAVMDGFDLIPAARDITVLDLLRMTSGLTYPDSDSAGRVMSGVFSEISEAIRKGQGYTTGQVLTKIAAAPLADQPGERWRYGLSADVLGGIIEVIAGRTLGEFFRQEIFEPLNMADTGFYVTPEKQGRLAQLYKRTEAGTLEIDQERHLGLTRCLEPPAFESGGAGLVSTLSDYANFANMLAAGGIWNGSRILTEASVEAFTVNMLPEALLPTVNFPQMKGYGYGNLMRVNLGRGESLSAESRGEFGWDGWSGPYVTIDRARRRVFLSLMQISGWQHWPFVWKMRDVLE